MALKNDYKDYISKTEDKKYEIRENVDGTHSLIDVTEYTQLGDKFGAWDINKTNTVINQLQDKSYITAHRRNFSLVNENQDVPFNLSTQRGENLTLLNGGIIVNRSMTVSISAFVFKHATSADSKVFSLCVNGVAQVNYKEHQHNETCVSFPAVIFNVAAGDRISIRCNESFWVNGSTNAGVGHGIMSYLTVQEL